MSETPRGAGDGGTDTELGLGGIWAFAGALVAVSVFAFAVMFAVNDRLKGARVAADPPPLPMPEASEPLPRPRAALQSDPVADMTRFREEEEKVLREYAWVDRAAGVARIPVERALEIAAEKGLPGVPAASSTGAATPTVPASPASPASPSVPARPAARSAGGAR